MTHIASSNPRVSIGMPLYNAEQYLALTLDSILAQTFSDFELVISDNGSTDRTQDICRAYAARDYRIRYYRGEVNHGAAWNHNRVFELSRGKYFKWASYDDLLAPEFLAKCYEVLEGNPGVVVCCTKVMDIDGSGNCMKIKSSKASTLPEPHQRFRALLFKAHTCEEIYGLMRYEVLRKTPLIAPHTTSDQNLLAELALHGGFYEVPAVLFFHRWHSKSTYVLWPGANDRWLWFDPHAAGRLLCPYWTQLFAFISSIRRASVSWKQRGRCYLHLGSWIKDWRKYFVGEAYWWLRGMLIEWVKAHLPWVRTAYRTLHSKGRA